MDFNEAKSRLYCAKSADAPSDELPSEDEAAACAELFNQHWLSHGEEPILDPFLVSLTFRLNQLCVADTRTLAIILHEIESRASAERIDARRRALESQLNLLHSYESEHQLHDALSQLSVLESLKKSAGECISKRGIGPGLRAPKFDGSKIDSYVTDPQLSHVQSSRCATDDLECGFRVLLDPVPKVPQETPKNPKYPRSDVGHNPKFEPGVLCRCAQTDFPCIERCVRKPDRANRKLGPDGCGCAPTDLQCNMRYQCQQ